jgi:hypothetical protein
MAVHVGDMFTDIRPADPEQAAGAADGQSGGGRTAEELWDEARGRLTWLKARTSATDFDD